MGELNTPETGRRLSASTRVGKSGKHEECHKMGGTTVICLQRERASPEHNDITADTNSPVGTHLEVERRRPAGILPL